MIKVSTKKRTLGEKFISVDEVPIGSTVSGTVFKKTTKGLVIELSKNVYGFIDSILYSDDPNELATRPPKFGQKIKCFVLDRERVKLNSRLALTSKKSFVESKSLLSSLEQLKENSQLNGIIVKIYDYGILVLLPFGLKVIFLTLYLKKNHQLINFAICKKQDKHYFHIYLHRYHTKILDSVMSRPRTCLRLSLILQFTKNTLILHQYKNYQKGS